MPVFETYEAENTIRRPLRDLYNNPRYPVAIHYALVEDGSENDNYHALPPTRPNTPVQPTNDNEPTTQSNARRWLPRL
ncbi:hypothetical protein NPIL_585881 [Nephila pilipes]|uniref:Uncharacterized protein n=1 Tax=Nephila pilipes TaxID=299642 RepID=A0A8X6MI20_NEPPI|nr:hypothetical protein NPIL_585881 [Nephila pilipes]